LEAWRLGGLEAGKQKSLKAGRLGSLKACRTKTPKIDVNAYNILPSFPAFSLPCLPASQPPSLLAYQSLPLERPVSQLGLGRLRIFIAD
jgi:hypothetical protein